MTSPDESNTVTLSGYVFECRHLSLGPHGIAQVATLAYNGGHGHIRVLAKPHITLALQEGDHLLIEGRLMGDHITIATATRLP